jgi:hypothetical protein
MLSILFRTLELAWHAHRLYPGAPIVRVAVVSYAAAAAETPTVPGEVLVAICEHESDLEPRAVSWRPRGGKRVDRIVRTVDEIPSVGSLACGLVSTIATTRARCVELLDPTVAMTGGVDELAEELHRCRGYMPCALSIYAGGHDGLVAWQTGEDTQATRFAFLFFERARKLGWRPGVPRS